MYVFKISFKALMLAGLVFVLALGLAIEQKVAGIVANLPAPVDQVKTEQKVMALTINVDWGGEFLPGILDALDQYDSKATFFLTGRWAKNNPEMVKELQARGQAIENHGYSHPHPDQITVNANQAEILKTEEIIQELTGIKTEYYAPPYGERGTPGLKAARNLGYTTILWTLDTVDWRPESTPEVITKRIVDPAVRFGVKPAREGALVLMHPKANTVQALPRILDQLTKEGFQFITVNELITLAGAGDTTSETLR